MTRSLMAVFRDTLDNSQPGPGLGLGGIKTEVLAGLTVALALVPEAVAFAFVAGVHPLVGLYAAFHRRADHGADRRAARHDFRRDRRAGGGDGGAGGRPRRRIPVCHGGADGADPDRWPACSTWASSSAWCRIR